MNIDTISIIVAYLDRCEDIKTVDEVYSFFDLATEEKEVCDQRWLRESHIEVGKGNIPEWVEEDGDDILEYHTMNGKLHREDENGIALPSVIYADGTRRWCRNGKSHREDKDENGCVLPATICADGTQRWYQNGKIHRDEKDENGFVLPAVIYADGSQWWYRNGEIHRDEKDENGFVLPAIIDTNGTLRWFRNGKSYRDDKDENGLVLPAILYADMI